MKLRTLKSKEVLIPERFFSINFWLEVLLITQFGKLSIFRELLRGIDSFLLLLPKLVEV